MTMTERVTAEGLYEQHRTEAMTDSDVQLPPWDRIPKWEQETWEELARDQDNRGPNH